MSETTNTSSSINGRSFFSVSLLVKLGIVTNKNQYFKKVNDVHRVLVINDADYDLMVKYATVMDQKVAEWIIPIGEVVNQDISLSDADLEEFSKVGYLQLIASELIAGKIKVYQ